MTQLPPSIAQFYPIGHQALPAASAADLLDAEIYEWFEAAVEEVLVLLRSGMICSIGWSSGKDSGVVLLITLEAYRRAKAEGILNQPLIVVHVRTQVEQAVMQMVADHEMAHLRRYCRSNNIELDLRVVSPKLRDTWPVVYASGAKALCTHLSGANFCSDHLKIRPLATVERQLRRQYDKPVVNLQGSYMKESTVRAARMKARGQDTITPEAMVIQGAAGETGLNFAPIRNWDQDLVWQVLRRAGSHPMVATTKPIPSYRRNHSLLWAVYQDAADGACPVTALKGVGGAGGCGKSRTGCWSCLKNPSDRSGEALATIPRFALMANALRVRDWLAALAPDPRCRTWHAKAIDTAMTPYLGADAVALQPNMLKPQYLERLIWYLCQLRSDDQERAHRFAQLVEAGTPERDPAYADILSTTDYDEQTRTEMLELYRTQAIKPQYEGCFDEQMALLISALHAQYGVCLPPWSPVVIMDRVRRGHRIPWPSKGEIDGYRKGEIPDAMILIPPPLPDGVARHIGELFQASDSLHNPVRTEIPSLSATQNGKSVKLTFRQSLPLTPAVRGVPLTVQRNVEATRRKTVIKRGQDGLSVDKGRTSLAWTKPTLEPKLQQAYLSPRRFWLPSRNATTEPDIIKPAVADTEGSLHLDPAGAEQVMAFMLEDIKADYLHHTLRAKGQRRSRFSYPGLRPLITLLRLGTLQIADHNLAQQVRITERTQRLANAGLFDLPHSRSIIHSPYAVPMTRYRQMRAKALLALRQERNARRRQVRTLAQSFQRNPLATDVARVRLDMSNVLTGALPLVLNEWAHALLNVEAGFAKFDGTDFRTYSRVCRVWWQEVQQRYLTPAGLQSQLQTQVQAFPGAAAQLQQLHREAVTLARGVIAEHLAVWVRTSKAGAVALDHDNQDDGQDPTGFGGGLPLWRMSAKMEVVGARSFREWLNEIATMGELLCCDPVTVKEKERRSDQALLEML